MAIEHQRRKSRRFGERILVRQILKCLLYFAGTLISQSSFAQSQPTNAKDVQADWQEYISAIKNGKGQGTLQFQYSENDGKERILNTAITFWHGNGKFVFHMTTDKNPGNAFGYNERYWFALTRPNEKSNWEIVEIGKCDGGIAECEEIMRKKMNSVLLHIAPRFGVASIGKTGDFTIESQKHNGSLIELEFSMSKFLSPAWFLDRKVKQSGNAVLDPGRLCLPRRFDVQYEVEATEKLPIIKGQTTAEYEYTDENPGTIIRSVVTENYSEGNQKIRRRMVLDLNHSIQSRSIDKENFMLTGFGLPEPNFGTKTPWSWILGLGVVLLVFLLIVGVKARRRN